MESNQTTELETVDVSYWADQLDALERLEKNEDFKKVVLEGYLKQKALDGVSLLADPGIKKRGERPEVMEELVAVSSLQYHFMMVHNLGEGARQELLDIEGPEVEEE